MDLIDTAKKVIKENSGFTEDERMNAIDYILWYTCCYHKEHLEKMSDNKVAEMYVDTFYKVHQ